jgi:hypothetical protein
MDEGEDEEMALSVSADVATCVDDDDKCAETSRYDCLGRE